MQLDASTSTKAGLIFQTGSNILRFILLTGEYCGGPASHMDTREPDNSKPVLLLALSCPSWTGPQLPTVGSPLSPGKLRLSGDGY